MRILILLSSIALLTVNSCKNDGCDDPLAFNYDENGTYSVAKNADYEIEYLSTTQTKITKQSVGTKNVKVNILL